MTIYRVTVTRTLYVVASSPSAARIEARNAPPNSTEEVIELEDATLDGVKRDRWLGCEPYGSSFGVPVEQMIGLEKEDEHGTR